MKGLSYKSVMVFFLCLQRKWGIALKKVCCQIAKNLHINMGRVTRSRGVVGYIENRKMEFVKEFVT